MLRVRSRMLAALLSLFVTCLLDAPSWAAEPLGERLREVLDLPRHKHAHWGLLFVDRETGETVFELNADRLFAPASVTKLYSVASAWDAFGPEHRFRTPVHRRGEVDGDGQLKGDLILVASGDLTMGGRTTDSGEIAFTDNDHTYANGSANTELTPQNPLAGLEQLARQIAAAGIRRVRGDVLIDARLFDSAEGTGSGPSRITPIQVNDNLIDFTIEPTEAGKPAKVTWRPQTDAIRVEVQFDTVPAGGKTTTWIQDLGAGRLHVHGQIAAGSRPVVRVYEVPDAAAHARTLLIEALERHGVRVDAPRLGGNDGDKLPRSNEYAGLPVVATLESPRFAENARLILKVSHNLHASTLPLLVAAKHGERTLSQGLRRQHAFLQRAGVDVETISFGGGAGGARSDYVTPRATVQLLRHMANRDDFADYHRALPILGVDGTLAKSVKEGSPARGKAQAKTGTLTWDNVMNGNSLLTSKALAGYLTTERGRKLAFAAFVNNVPLRDGLAAKSIGDDLGRICEIVYARGE